MASNVIKTYSGSSGAASSGGTWKSVGTSTNVFSGPLGGQVSFGSPNYHPTYFNPERARIEQEVEMKICIRINAILDGRFDYSGPGVEPWESTRKRLMALAKISRCLEMRIKDEVA
jgi:hypothetical protein